MSAHLIILAPAALHRQAWRTLLNEQPGLSIDGVAGDLDEVRSLLVPERATAVLVDLPAADAGVARRVKALAPHVGVLFLVHGYDLDAVIPLLQAGAVGVVSRDAQVGDLARALIAAARGEVVLPPEIASRALATLARGERQERDPVEPLSEREREVLRHLARGLTNKDIAQSLVLSVRTVEAHLRSIYGKLGVRSRTEAVLWAVRHGHGEGEAPG